MIHTAYMYTYAQQYVSQPSIWGAISVQIVDLSREALQTLL